MSDCPNFGKLIGGCNFEARYDERSNPDMHGIELKGSGPVGSARRYFILDIYVRDICTRCGKVVERKP